MAQKAIEENVLYNVRHITVINVISLLLDYVIKQLIMCC